MKKHEISALLRRELDAVMNERRAAKSSETTRLARNAVKIFQSGRMAVTHADLLADPSSRAAARFFLDDLYGVQDMTQRDLDIERIIPTMERLLPAPALATIAEAIVLDAMSESLDATMASRLQGVITEATYIEAYCESTKKADRTLQLAHVRSLGDSLCELVRMPMLGTTLSLMRGPAELAGLSSLHSFLKRGFTAFRAMRHPRAFVDTIILRETAILENLYAGRDQPFNLNQAQRIS